jgi:uncharacterized lipoprotein YbaY
MNKIVISGNIEIPKELINKKFEAYVKILDTSYEDAPAIIIGETKVGYPGSTLTGKNHIPFEVNVEVGIDKSHDYTLSVLIDLDEDGTISKNDYIHQQAYTAIAQGIPRKDILVTLQKV